MHLRVIVAALVVCLSTAAAASPDDPEWIVWSDDGQDAVLPFVAGDIDKIRVGPTAAALHLALSTFPATVGAPAPASEVVFHMDQAREVEVRFEWQAGPALWIDGTERTSGWSVSDTSGPLDWQLSVSWSALGIQPHLSVGLRGLEATASAGAGGDAATGPDLVLAPDGMGGLSASAVVLAAGATIEGPDFAGGTSIAVDSMGEPLLSYYVYDDTGGEARGIYLARIDHAEAVLVPERIAETQITRDYGRDGQMRTQVAHDGTDAFVLFTDDPAVDNDEDGPGHPGTPDSVYVLARVDGAWAREDPTPDGASDVGPEDVADLAARDGRVVAAVPVGPDVWVVERSGPGAWTLLARLPEATNAKLALDSTGTVHVAFVVYGPEGNLRDGVLYYASSEDGFDPVPVGENIEAGWEEPETDGSFAIAVGPDDEVALVWNDGGARDREKEQPFAVIKDGDWSHGFAPLKPGHGNPQYTMRLGFAGSGALVAGSGYGGTDSLAMRTPDGGWSRETLPRYDVWDMAVAPSGLVYFGYTQPHGGTTLAITAYGQPGEHVGALAPTDADRRAGEPQDLETFSEEVPGPGLAAVAVALAGVLVRRR